MTNREQTPQVDGVDLKVSQLDGPSGLFRVAFAGGHKEGDQGFFYQDERARFFFYGELKTKPVLAWTIYRATLGPWSGSPIRAGVEDEAAFRRNIEFFFQTRSWFMPHQPGDAGTAAAPITFVWMDAP
jgi:hypothetical protein